MRYLKITRCAGMYDYIPLDNASFEFREDDDACKYNVEIRSDGRIIKVFENKYIYQMDTCMKRISRLVDGIIVTPEELFD